MKKLLSLVLSLTIILSTVIIISVPTAARSMIGYEETTFTLNADTWLDNDVFELKAAANLQNTAFSLTPENATHTVYDGQSLRIGDSHGDVVYKTLNGKLVAVVNKGSTDASGYKPIIVFTAPYYGTYSYSADIELVSAAGSAEFNGFRKAQGWDECKTYVTTVTKTGKATYVNNTITLNPGDIIVFSLHETSGAIGTEIALSINVEFIGSDDAQIKFTPNVNNKFGASFGLYASLSPTSVGTLYELSTRKTSSHGKEYLETGLWSATEAAPSDSSYPAYLPVDASVNSQYAHAVNHNGTLLLTGRDDYTKYIVVKFTAPADSTYDVSTKAEYFNNMVPGKIFINGYYIRSFDLPAEVPGAGAAPTSLGQLALTKGDEVCLMFSASAWAGTRVYDVIATYHAPDPAELGYTASILHDGLQNVQFNSNVYVKLNVNKTGQTDDTGFSAAELELTYDRNYFTFDVGASGLNENQCLIVEGENGINTLFIEDYGTAQSFGDAYVLSFKGIKTTEGQTPSTSKITLANAAFSKAADAEKQNLKTARILQDTVAFTILKERFNVTLNGDFFNVSGDAIDGDPFEIIASQSDNYDYKNVSFIMGGSTVTPTYDSTKHTWTISAVTGDITVTADVTPKRYPVTIIGSVASSGGDTAVFNSDYSFTIPDDIERTELVDGHYYTVYNLTVGSTAIIVNGQIQDGTSGIYNVNGRTYVIDGSFINGAISAEIKEEILKANGKVTLTINGQAGAITGAPTQIKSFEDFAFTLNNATPGYDYTITYKVGGVEKGTLIPVDGVYTIPGDNIDANVTINVVATVKVNVIIYEYMAVNGAKMFLIVNKVEKLSNGTCYALWGSGISGVKSMFWSDKYEGYCYLAVVNGENSVFSDSGLSFKIIRGEATVLHAKNESAIKRYDLNGTGKVDINDAQLVYNMYMAKMYADFTDNVTVEIFLRADINGTVGVNVEDVRGLVSYILG